MSEQIISNTAKSPLSSKGVRGIGGLKALINWGIGFVALSLLLNATGIRLWAQRLEIQDSWVPRVQLIELATAWEALLEPTGLNMPRQQIAIWRSKLEQSKESEIKAAQELPEKAKSQDQKEPREQTPSTVQSPLKEVQKDSAPLSQDVAQHQELSSPAPAISSAFSGYVALTGDSMMAVSLGPNLAKWIEKTDGLKTIRAYKSGTGLSRPDVFNWLIEYPKMLAGRRPTIVICAIGANDAQGFEVNKKVIPFGTPAWDEEYAKRAQAFIELMLKDGAKVYWVLLPHMRSPVYSQKMQNLNAFLQERFKHYPNLTFISPDALMVGRPVQSYVEFSPGEQQKMDRLRGDDGIHLSEKGGQRLARGLWAKINAPQ